MATESTPPELPTLPIPPALPSRLTQPPPLRNALHTAVVTSRAAISLATETGAPFDPIHFMDGIDPAAAIADAHSNQPPSNPRKSDQSQNQRPLPSSPNSSPAETVTFRGRRVTLTGKYLAPNDLPQLPAISTDPISPAPSPNPAPTPPPPEIPAPFPLSADPAGLSPALLRNVKHEYTPLLTRPAPRRPPP